MNKILIYVGGLTSCEKGAVGTHTMGIIKAFSASDIFQKIYVLGTNLHCFRQINVDIIEIPINNLSSGNVFFKTIFYKKYTKTLLSKINEIIEHYGNCEILIYNRFALNISHGVFKLLATNTNSNIKSILEYNDITIDQIDYLAKRKSWGTIGSIIRSNYISKQLISRQEKYVFNNAGLIVAVTDKIKQYILSISPSANVIVVPNATDVSLIAANEKISLQEIRKELKLPTDKFIISHVGTLTSWDGLIELIHAFKKFSYRNRSLLVIIGDGLMKTSIKELILQEEIQADVILKDAMPFAEAIKYVQACNVVPLLKTIDSYQLSPIKFYEAMGLGKVLICTDVAYINEIKNTNFGKVVSLPLNIDNITDALEALYEDRNENLQLKNTIQRYAKENHTWDARVRAILNNI